MNNIESGFIPNNENGEGCWNKTHDPLDLVFLEAKRFEHFSHKLLVEFIIGFSYVKFHHHPQDLLSFDWVEHFINPDDTIHYLTTFNKPQLF